MHWVLAICLRGKMWRTKERGWLIQIAGVIRAFCFLCSFPPFLMRERIVYLKPGRRRNWSWKDFFFNCSLSLEILTYLFFFKSWICQEFWRDLNSAFVSFGLYIVTSSDCILFGCSTVFLIAYILKIQPL